MEVIPALDRVQGEGGGRGAVGDLLPWQQGVGVAHGVGAACTHAIHTHVSATCQQRVSNAPRRDRRLNMMQPQGILVLYI